MYLIFYVDVNILRNWRDKKATDEIVYNPKDKSRLSQMKDGGNFLAGFIGGDKDTVGSSVGIVSAKALCGKPH